MSQYTESLIKARDCAGMAVADIREALKHAELLESLVLVDALKDALTAHDRLGRLVEAVEGSS